MKKGSSSNINFPKSQALWAGAYKNRIGKPGQMVLSQFSFIILGVHLVNSVHNNNNWNNIIDKLTKQNIWNSVRLFLRG